MIPAQQKDDTLWSDIEQAPPDTPMLWWLGQSGFLFSYHGQRILFDPYLSDSLTRKYADTDKPHTRMTERVIAPEAITGLDLLTSSHNHTDHLDAETLQPLLERNPGCHMVFPEANRATVEERLGSAAGQTQLHGMDAGETVVCGKIEVSAIPAAHNTVERDAAGRCRFLGFVVSLEGFTIYHSGDTLWHDTLVEALKPHRIDLAILPINGNRPERRVAGNLDGAEAAELAHTLGMRCVIPCHYEMFTFNTATPELFVETCRKHNQPHRVLRAGEGVSLSDLKQPG